jgi:hypothetical protein
MVLVCNKTDIKDAVFAKEWMTDFEAFQAAVRAEKGADGEEGMGYMGSLLGSMGLVLEEFYNHLDVVGVSSLTGAGVPEFFRTMADKRAEYENEYKPELERRIRERTEEGKTAGLDKLMKDMNVGTQRMPSSMGLMTEPVHLDTISDGEDEDDGYLVDPDPMEDDDEEGLQRKFQQAALNAQTNAGTYEDREFDRWATEANRGGI